MELSFIYGSETFRTQSSKAFVFVFNEGKFRPIGLLAKQGFNKKYNQRKESKIREIRVEPTMFASQVNRNFGSWYPVRVSASEGAIFGLSFAHKGYGLALYDNASFVIRCRDDAPLYRMTMDISSAVEHKTRDELHIEGRFDILNEEQITALDIPIKDKATVLSNIYDAEDLGLDDDDSIDFIELTVLEPEESRFVLPKKKTIITSSGSKKTVATVKRRRKLRL